MSKLKSTARLLVAITLLLTVAQVALSYPDDSPVYCCGPSYTFGEAKAAVHGPYLTGYGFFYSNGLVIDPTNNGGNAFLGNTITIRPWTRTITYWYDWSADPLAVSKLSVWGNNIGMWDMLTYQYDPDTMMIVSITSPRFP